MGTLFDGFMNEDLERNTKIWEETIGDYCMDDCQNTFKLYKYFQKSINDQDPAIWKVYKELSIPFMKVLVDMEMRGICMDLDYLKEME